VLTESGRTESVSSKSASDSGAKFEVVAPNCPRRKTMLTQKSRTAGANDKKDVQTSVKCRFAGCNITLGVGAVLLELAPTCARRMDL